MDALLARPQLLLVTAAAALFAAAALALSGWLKQQHGWRTADSRKTFHFLIFGGAAVAHTMTQSMAQSVAHTTAAPSADTTVGFLGVCAYGAGVSAIVLVALWRGAGHPWFEALARESDAPQRALYVFVPWLATALGGLASNLLFADAALFGYLVVGIADAVAEPIGSRFGRHRYRVPIPGKVPTIRSFEGSAAVLVASFLACGAAFLLLPEPLRSAVCPVAPSGVASLVDLPWLRLLAIATIATLLEAVSPHGADNFVVQLGASAAAHALLLAPAAAG